MTTEAASQRTTRRARRPGPFAVVAGALGLFFAVLALLAQQVRAGADPALGPAAQPALSAPAQAAPPAGDTAAPAAAPEAAAPPPLTTRSS
jgi:hypothetical protein